MVGFALRSLVVVGLASVLGAAPAAAQSASAQAEVLFRDARALLDAGKVSEACDAFSASHKLDPRVTTLINLASCRERNGQLATAWVLYLDVEAQTRGSADAAAQQMSQVASQKAGALDRRLSRLVITVPDGSRRDGLVVTKGGEVVAPAVWGRSVPVDGGTVVVEATAPGALPWRAELEIAREGDAKSVEVPPLDAAPIGPVGGDLANGDGVVETRGAVEVPMAPATDAPRRAGGVLRWVVLGGAVAALATAGGMELWTRSLYADAKASQDAQERTDLYDAAVSRRNLAVGFAVVGVGLAATATWLFVRDRGDAAPPATRAAGTAGVRVVPWLDPASAGVAFSGWF